ncbi:MAG: glutamate--cysteine ligase [Planctomycetes bacterium]|nr:glutamate--cysteine ligase [Planctomycetota bacterium]
MTLGLFDGFGIELEYMVVDAATFAVRPVVDELLRHFAGRYVGDFDDGPVSWSNELALHVVELKTNGPSPTLAGLGGAFATSARRLDAALAPMGARLCGGGMHPLMDPAREFRRWPHDYGDVYGAYDRIFDCRGHGWSNLQSCHLNLPFANDDEFGRLHLACRALLPLLPALAASSPYAEGRHHGWLDWRLSVYRHNQERVPRIAGQVVPEPVTTRADYFTQVLEPIWSDIAPFDPEHLLREEWLNSRGVVAKFSRDSLEIRVLDVQEHPAADLAISTLIVAVLRQLAAARWCSLAALAALPTGELASLLWRVARLGERATIDHAGLLLALGLPSAPLLAGEVWRRLAERLLPDVRGFDAALERPLQTILTRGPRARRLLDHYGETPSRDDLLHACHRLADCLAGGESFVG